jgi:4-hydroxy-tetrahydrodipicolinate reductase
MTRILLVGYGKMGRLVGELAPGYGCEVAGIVDPEPAAGERTPSVPPGSPRPVGRVSDADCSGVDVAVDFTTPDAVLANVTALAGRGLNIVLGTTGWQQHEAALRQVVADSGIGIVAAPNFSTGVVLFEAIVARAAALMAQQPEFGAYLHEVHHAMKKDAPSGTALMLERAMKEAGFARPIDVAASRAGHVPGTHTIVFDAPSESITLVHAARDRGAFARGALAAARWVEKKQGWFTMHDVLGVRG